MLDADVDAESGYANLWLHVVTPRADSANDRIFERRVSPQSFVAKLKLKCGGAALGVVQLASKVAASCARNIADVTCPH